MIDLNIFKFIFLVLVLLKKESSPPKNLLFYVQYYMNTIPLDLSLFITDTKHKEIISYMLAIDEFITKQLSRSLFSKCITKRLTLDITNITPTPSNQIVFTQTWDKTQRNFDEASCKAKYRRELEYNDKLILTLFYVLYNIDLYDEYDITEVEKGILVFSDKVSLEHNDMGQTYVSLYKQLQKCCIKKDNAIVISEDKAKEYFIG